MALVDMVKRNEGLRLSAYDDGRGTLTIGYGHTGNDVYAGQVCTQEQAEVWLQSDLYTAGRSAETVVGNDIYAALTDARHAALTDMAFNLGEAGLSEFHHMLAAIRSGNWQMAHDAALASKWAREVGARATYDAWLILNGSWT